MRPLSSADRQIPDYQAFARPARNPACTIPRTELYAQAMDAKATFKKCVQVTQQIGDAGGSEDRLLATLVFDLEVNGKKYSDMQTEIRQPHGSNYHDEINLPIEVSKPTGSYKGPFHHESFRIAAENYYRGVIGGKGKVIRVAQGAKVNMQIGTIQMAPQTFTIEIPDKGGAW